MAIFADVWQRARPSQSWSAGRDTGLGHSDALAEREADQAANTILMGRRVCDETEQGAVRRAGSDRSALASSDADRALGGDGRPMEGPVRSSMESRFGLDFSRVRIHAGPAAADAAALLNASAFTFSPHIAFGRNEYQPGTTEGRRLLAHELAHVVQQSISGTPGVQRQAAPPTPASQGAAIHPGYQEERHGPSFRVHIVAHASPRWRSARSDAKSDRLNLELSRRRAEAVRIEVAQRLAEHFPEGVGVSVETLIDDRGDEAVEVSEEARGSRDTLSEALGSRSANAARYRRVDVTIDATQRISGLSRQSRRPLRRPTNSRFWHVGVVMSAGASVGVAGALIQIELTNDSTGKKMQGPILALGGGPKASVGASAGVWTDPSGFYTDDPIDFRDFNGVEVVYKSGGFQAFLGYSWASISFKGLGSGAQNVDVSGWGAGTAGGLGGNVVRGNLELEGIYPPTSVPIEHSDVVSTRYERTERGVDEHRVLFPTGSAEIVPVEAAILDSFIDSVIDARR